MTSPAFDAAVHIIGTLPATMRDTIGEALNGYTCTECGTSYVSALSAQACCQD